MLIEMLSLEFMQRAMIASLLVGIAAPLVGVFVVQRNMSLLGDGLGHVALAGVTAGLLTSTNPVWTALLASVVAGVLVEMLRASKSATADVAIAFMFYGGIAAGVVLMSRVPSGRGESIESYLFGSVLTTTREDVIAFAALCLVIVVLVTLFGSRLFTVGNDEEYARAIGMPVAPLNYMLAVLTAATVVLSMRVIGLLLISALIVLPVAAAARLARGFLSTLLLGVAFGLIISAGGVTVAYAADTPSGGTVVLLGIALYAVTYAISYLWRLGRTRHRTPQHTTTMEVSS